jgi:ATP-dependent Clp protease protease subunit
MNLNFYEEFKDYAIKHMGIDSLQMHYWEQLQNELYNKPQVFNSITPMVLEEREVRATLMSVFDRMMMDRIIWLAGPVNDRMSTVVQAQLMFLDNIEVKDITIHIDSPGGSTKSGKSIVDVMDYVASDIVTINTGMAASMGSVLLVCGKKGKRFSLPSSKVMIHQVSSGAYGNIQDMRISLEEAEKENESLFKILGDKIGKRPEQVKQDGSRDKWFSAQEALDYGIIDSIITNKIKK